MMRRRNAFMATCGILLSCGLVSIGLFASVTEQSIARETHSFTTLRDLNGDGVINVLDVFRLLGGADQTRQADERDANQSNRQHDASRPSNGEGHSTTDTMETISVDQLPANVGHGGSFSILLKLSNNTTPLFGYSVAIRAVPANGAVGAVSVNVNQTNFFLTHNLIAAASHPMDQQFSVIQPWNTGGVFVSANTADGSTVLAIPSVNDVLAQVRFNVSANASGIFNLQLGPATALADGNGFAVPYVFTGGAIHVCLAGDINCDGCINVSDLLAMLGSWGQCPVLPPDINHDNIVNVDDLLILINSWGQMGPGLPADLNQNGIVNVDDLLILLNHWGEVLPTCPDLDGNGFVNVNDLLILIGQWGCQ